MKQKRPGGVRRLIFVVALLTALFCIGYIFWWFLGSRQHLAESREAAAQYVAEPETAAVADDTAAAASGETSTETEAADGVQVDFPALQAVSSDVVGWLRVSGLDLLDEPVVHRDDNFFLTHGWDGQSSQYGAIFMEEANATDFSDYHTILYGHNMRDGSMFGELDRYADADFFAEHGGLITLYTPDGTRQYQIFAAEYVDPADPIVYTVGFSPSEEYSEFLRGMLDRALYDTGVELRSDDRVLTLSTCSYQNRARFVVHAKELAE
ncbi:MAG: class B sortase [Oscillospiraceae bacterium]|nr:class B sortase [Oscillospiraceae bacterium]